MAGMEKAAATSTLTNTIAHSQAGPQEDYYPPAVSSYYFGPPDSSRAFGEPITGKPGIHLPKEIVRIERDYSAGELPQFHPSFPLELEGRISPTTFSEIVNDINTLVIAAHNPTRTWIDNSLAILTLYLSSTLFGTHYTRKMKELHHLIQNVNRETLMPVGLVLVDPSKTAFLFVEVEYY